MKILGSEVKKARKEMHLSQTQLAKNICTQATISNIEKKNTCDSLEILTSICLRLNIEIEDVLVETSEKRTEKIFQEIEFLCNKGEHKKAYEYLNKKEKELDHHYLEENQSKYHFYRGITYFLGASNDEDAFFHLYIGSENRGNLNIYNILSINSIGILYDTKKDLDKSRVYFAKSIKLLGELKTKLPIQAAKIYYNSAKFYSSIEDHKTCKELCEAALTLINDSHSTYILDYLCYGKAHAQYHLSNDADEEYMIAYSLAKLFKNDYLIQMIEEDMQNYNISFPS